MSKFRRQISGRAFNFLVSAFSETSPIRQIFYLLRMVMHASPSDTLAKFSPLRQTVEGFVVDLVRDVSVLKERMHAQDLGGILQQKAAQGEGDHISIS